MSRNDIRIKSSPYATVPTLQWKVAAGTPVTIKAGEPALVGGTSSNAVVLPVDADVTIGTDQPIAGIAAKDSTETAAVAGVCDVYMPLPGIEYEIAAKTASLANTAALILALQGAYYVLDLTSSVFTMDTAAGDGASNAFIITGGDSVRSLVYFLIRSDATWFGRARV